MGGARRERDSATSSCQPLESELQESRGMVLQQSLLQLSFLAPLGSQERKKEENPSLCFLSPQLLQLPAPPDICPFIDIQNWSSEELIKSKKEAGWNKNSIYISVNMYGTLFQLVYVSVSGHSWFSQYSHIIPANWSRIRLIRWRLDCYVGLKTKLGLNENICLRRKFLYARLIAYQQN